MSDAFVCRTASGHEYSVEVESWDDDDDIELTIACVKCDITGTKIVRWEDIGTWSVGGGLHAVMVETPYPEGYDAPEGDDEEEDDG